MKRQCLYLSRNQTAHLYFKIIKKFRIIEKKNVGEIQEEYAILLLVNKTPPH